MVRRSASRRGDSFTSTSRRSHSRLKRTEPSLELGQESKIVFVEEPDVGNAVTQHGNAFHSHAGGIPGNRLGIVAHLTEHLGVHHSRSENLDPPRLLTDAAAALAA